MKALSLFYSALQSITFPSTLTTIGSYAFSDCTAIDDITIPDSVTSLGAGAFFGTTWFDNIDDEYVIRDGILYKYKGNEKKITLPSNIRRIENGVFSGAQNLESVIIPDTVTELADGLFYNTNLKEVVLPNTIAEISEGMFFGSNIETMRIPDSVTKIGANAFEECFSLRSIKISASVKEIHVPLVYNSMMVEDERPFEEFIVDENNPYFSSEDGVLYNKDKTELISCPIKKSEVNIPSTVKKIGNYAFYSCNQIKKIKIPYGVTEIGEAAFYSCMKLSNPVLPDSVTKVGSFAFGVCRNLGCITIPYSVTEIGKDITYNTRSAGFIVDYPSLAFEYGTAYRHTLGRIHRTESTDSDIFAQSDSDTSVQSDSDISVQSDIDTDTQSDSSTDTQTDISTSTDVTTDTAGNEQPERSCFLFKKEK